MNKRPRGSIATRIRAFLAREAVLAVAAAAALASCALVPPDAAYAHYIDWHTLALLFCLMTVVAGFRKLGVLDAAGAWLVARARTPRAVATALVALAFVASMLVTNDVALITFVPLALVVLRRANMEARLCLVATLMTVAANLGSMLTPVGNPQNLYLFTASGMSIREFLQLMTPYTLASAALLTAVITLAFREKPTQMAKGKGLAKSESVTSPVAVVRNRQQARRESNADANDARTFCSPSGPGFSEGERPGGQAKSSEFTAHPIRFALYLALFIVCLAAVAGVLDVRVLLAVVLLATALSDACLLRRVDWGLLATFVALFVFVGNMARVPLLHDALAAAVDGNALLAAVGASQVISNVPAAVLLSGFTDQWSALIVGTNLGGLGTLIASMASLITFKAVAVGRAGIRAHYLRTFTLVNVAFLTALLALAFVSGPTA